MGDVSLSKRNSTKGDKINTEKKMTTRNLHFLKQLRTNVCLQCEQNKTFGD